jgi:hypothetical protein
MISCTPTTKKEEKGKRAEAVDINDIDEGKDGSAEELVSALLDEVVVVHFELEGVLRAGEGKKRGESQNIVEAARGGE